MSNIKSGKESNSPLSISLTHRQGVRAEGGSREHMARTGVETHLNIAAGLRAGLGCLLTAESGFVVRCIPLV